ncbi:exocyst complex component EXO70A1-like isoform X2 [Canna indica]|uniref:Exocyst subunit Exo70 family protein n=1 Tax=Canna indica TaxID=4628 RepID=A0AAQ3QGF0_9LILI|nr:exocyst complex component EXO70A1-like isoform X2 [Canna indica]
MAVPQTIDTLSRRASLLKESLEKSQSNTESMVTILGSFDHRLSALEAAMRPIQVRTHAIRMAHENIDKTLKVAEQILTQFDISRQAEATILRGPHEDLESYLEAVDLLKNTVQFFTSNKCFKGCDVVNHINNLLGRATLKLEEEFKNLLAAYSKPIEPDRLFDCLPKSLQPTPESGGNQVDGGKNASANHPESQGKSLETAVYKTPTLIPPRVLPLLHDLVTQLVQAGHLLQCAKIYREARASTLESSLRKLGVEKLSKDDVQKMQWEALETKIQNWIHFMRIAVKLLFAGERKICDQIFDGTTLNKDQCFADVTSNSVAVLLSFGDAVAKSKRSPEKLFVLLDMYEVLHELHTEIETIFEGKACSEMREAAISLSKRLAETAEETFVDFEEAVEKDATKTTVLDGTVHPLTSYVINYVKFLFDYQSTLKQLFQEFVTEDQTESQLAVVTMRIMQALQSNLDSKSKQYKDPALTYLFLMNNIHYMVRSLSRSEAKDVLGDDWVQRHRRIVQQNANQYKRVAWAKILQTLTVQGLTSSGSSSALGSDANKDIGISRAQLKERFKSFNVQFEELHQRQSQWTVPDQELREYLRLAIAEVLLPAYRSFIKRFGPMVENGKNPMKYIRYSPEDLERMLSEFFEGKTLGEPKR